jgi:hypothetical protein
LFVLTLILKKKSDFSEKKPEYPERNTDHGQTFAHNKYEIKN